MDFRHVYVTDNLGKRLMVRMLDNQSGEYKSVCVDTYNIPPKPVTPITDFETRVVDNVCYLDKYIGTNKDVVVPNEDGEGHKTEICGTFYLNENIETVDLSNMSSLISVCDFGLCHVFEECSSLQSIDLSNVISVGEEGLVDTFFDCTSLQSVNLSNVINIDFWGFEYIFGYCTSLTSISFPKLTSIGDGGFYYAFFGCTNIEDIYFPALTTQSFGSDTYQFMDMMMDTGTSVVHKIHFPSNLESTISKLDTYPLFGGDSGYVQLLYDLPATS